MVLNLMLIGLAVALDPLPLSAFMIVLPSRRGVRKGAAYVFGWLVSLAIVVAITVLATGASTSSLPEITVGQHHRDDRDLQTQAQPRGSAEAGSGRRHDD